jgi:hypothetical protein
MSDTTVTVAIWRVREKDVCGQGGASTRGKRKGAMGVRVSVQGRLSPGVGHFHDFVRYVPDKILVEWIN